MNVRLPGGSTVDTAMFFGDRGAPNPSNLCMNWLLFMIRMLLYIRLQQVSTWCVFKGCEYTPPAISTPSKYGASSSEALRRAFAWDRHPKVRAWRQRRFDIATIAGLSQAEAYWQSIPFCLQGYFDDGQFAIAACLLYILIESILELVNLVGVGLSYTKMVISFLNDIVCKVDIAQHVKKFGGKLRLWRRAWQRS